MAKLKRVTGDFGLIEHVQVWREEKFSKCSKKQSRRIVAALLQVPYETYRGWEDSGVFKGDMAVAAKMALMANYPWKEILSMPGLPDYGSGTELNDLLLAEYGGNEIDEAMAHVAKALGRVGARKKSG